MARIRPIHGVLVVAVVSATVLVADYALEGGFRRAEYRRVGPDVQGNVAIDVSDLAPDQVRFYRFLNPSNQEVRFFVGRDHGGDLQVAFDANQICYKTQRGFKFQDGWMVCNKCDKSFELARVNSGGLGCSPVPVAHRVVGDRLLLTEDDLLTGWRYFR